MGLEGVRNHYGQMSGEEETRGHRSDRGRLQRQHGEQPCWSFRMQQDVRQIWEQKGNGAGEEALLNFDTAFNGTAVYVLSCQRQEELRYVGQHWGQQGAVSD